MVEKRILVIDDLPFMRRVIREILEGTRLFWIDEAENGLDGLHRYRDIKPDLVLLDIVMPVMDGISTLERLIKMDPKARVVMCSALGQEALIVHAIRLGAKDFVVKPFHPNRLITAVHRALET
ncbi:MAG: response regulator [Spirochaetes bacterium]|nr:response regulator [Spirochaetota bacterium]